MRNAFRQTANDSLVLFGFSYITLRELCAFFGQSFVDMRDTALGTHDSIALGILQEMITVSYEPGPPGILCILFLASTRIDLCFPLKYNKHL